MFGLFRNRTYNGVIGDKMICEICLKHMEEFTIHYDSGYGVTGGYVCWECRRIVEWD